MILHLGVNDIPYASEHGTTTGDVASILETKYRVMERFFELHGKDIADAMAQNMAEAITNMMAGKPMAADKELTATAMSKTQKAFSIYLDTEEIVKTGPIGVPTKAALKGRSKRFKRNRGPRRPSFIDTGDYQQSFIAWVDN